MIKECNLYLYSPPFPPFVCARVCVLNILSNYKFPSYKQTPQAIHPTVAYTLTHANTPTPTHTNTCSISWLCRRRATVSMLCTPHVPQVRSPCPDLPVP
jgi:hypothetical protein